MRFLTISKDSEICSFTASRQNDTKLKSQINKNTTIFVAQAIPECKYSYKKKWSLWSEELSRLTMNSTMKLYYLHQIEESSRCNSFASPKIPQSCRSLNQGQIQAEYLA